jgi:ABC-type multidrug transport system fused ATPase/permease subunit
VSNQAVDDQAKPQTAAPGAKQKAVSADEGSTLSTLVNLWPYIWPAHRPDLKGRVMLAVVALVLAKFVTVLSPYFFAWSTDALTGETAGLPAFLIAPVMLVLAYNAARAFSPLPSTSCAMPCLPVSASTPCASSPILTFRHLHQLSLRFHLAAQDRRSQPGDRARREGY